MNDMFGKYNLEGINSYDEYIQTFMNDFRSKMEKAKNSPKFNKAETPEAIAKVKQIRKQIDSGLQQVEKLIRT